MRHLTRVVAAVLTAAAFVPVPAQSQTIKIGIVTFLSGPAAAPFGVPAKNAAELMVEALNAGKVPGPYGKKGFGGEAVEAVIIDEAGTTTTQVTEFRNLVQRSNVDVVIGYVSSGNCLAVAPVAEELKKLTNFFDCGTPRIFEDGNYQYVFRTSPTATMDNVGARGPFGPYAPKSALNTWFVKEFEAKNKVTPNYASYQMAQAILGIKVAWEKAQAAIAGKRPSNNQVAAAFEYIKFEGPGGQVDMANGKGHQAIMETAYGTTKLVNGKITLTNVKRYPAEKVNPPEGVKAADWIKGGFK